MKRVMLAIFSVAEVDKAVRRSFELVERNGGELFVTFILEEKVPSALSSLMMYTGFLGEKVQEDVKETIRKEYRRRVNKLMEEIRKKAREKGLRVSTEILNEASLMQCYDLIVEKNIDYIVINYTKDEFISRDVHDYYINEFIDNLDVPNELYLDGQKM